MKFISHIRKFQVGILQPVVVNENGLQREIVPMHVAEFKRSDLTADELQFAMQKYDQDAHGRTLERDEVTKSSLLGRLSSYDTDTDENQRAYDEIDMAMIGQRHRDLPRGQEWAEGDAERLTIEKLLKRAETSTEFCVYEATPTVAPWPAYNEFPGSPEELLDVLVAQQHHLPTVAQYERENLKRREVLDLLEEEIARTAPVSGPEVVLS